MSFSFNPVTGLLDLVGEGSSGKQYTVERFTLSATDITNGYIVLTSTPSDASLVRLTVIEGIEQDNGVDFTMLPADGNKRLSWNGLGLDGILEENDKIIVWYNKNT